MLSSPLTKAPACKRTGAAGVYKMEQVCRRCLVLIPRLWSASLVQDCRYPFRPVIDQEACRGIQGSPAMASRRASRGWMPWLRAVPR